MVELETQLRELVDLSPPTTPPLSPDELRRRAADHGARDVRRRAPFVLAAAAAILAVAVLGAVAIGRNVDTTPAGPGDLKTEAEVPAEVKRFLRASVELRHAVQREGLWAMRLSGSGGARGADGYRAAQADTDRTITAWRDARPPEITDEQLRVTLAQADSRLNQLRTLRNTATNAFADGRNLAYGYENAMSDLTPTQSASLNLIEGPLYRKDWLQTEATADLARLANADAGMAMRLLMSVEVGFYATLLPKNGAPGSRLDTLASGCGDRASEPLGGQGAPGGGTCETYTELVDARDSSKESLSALDERATPELKVIYRSEAEEVAFTETVNQAVDLGNGRNDLSSIDGDAAHRAAVGRLDRLKGIELKLIDSFS